MYIIFNNIFITTTNENTYIRILIKSQMLKMYNTSIIITLGFEEVTTAWHKKEQFPSSRYDSRSMNE